MTYPHDDRDHRPVDLSEFEDAFQAAPDPDPDGGTDRTPVPDGQYQAVVDRVEIKETRNGDPRLAWTLRIVAGPKSGRLLFRGNMLVTPDNWKWLKVDLARCGVEPLRRASDLHARLGDLLDRILEVKVQTRPGRDGKPNQNIWINGLVSAGDDSARGGPTDGFGPTDDGLPF